VEGPAAPIACWKTGCAVFFALARRFLISTFAASFASVEFFE
jgi:hypothetical protein